MQLPAFVATWLGRLAYEFIRVQPLIPTYVHLLVAALAPIYAGAHASLSRPSSAAKSDRSKKKEDDEDEDEEAQRMEGLSPLDAILFPLLAGSTLVGLYFLIKWLQDPAILNKILNWYFATFSVFSVSRLVSDGMDVLHSLVFPHRFIDGGVLFHVKQRSRTVVPSKSGPMRRSSPLPWAFSRLPLPDGLVKQLWNLRVLPNQKMQIKAFIRGVVDLKFGLGIHGMEGLVVGLSTVLWYNFMSKPWFLTNIMAFGFAYGSLQLMSPTTFWTGTLILSALFFYDIYFVFFTPVMATVAKSLDIPIKLLFPRPPEPDADPTSQALSMLGLGDVVLPGMMIGLALRFDLFMFYLRKQTKASKEEASVVKATYRSVAGAWGDRVWTFARGGTSKTQLPRNAFPKPYFHASIAGYILGMLVTLAAMQVSNHPQPALLYLVPGVLIALWGTALIKGQVEEMWKFSDAAEQDESSQRSKSGSTSIPEAEPITKRSSFFSLSKEKGEDQAKRLSESVSKHPSNQDSDIVTEASEDRRAVEGTHKEESGTSRTKSEDRTLFSFSIALPPLLSPEAQKSSARLKEAVDAAEESSENSPRYSLRSTKGEVDRHADKKLRVS